MAKITVRENESLEDAIRRFNRSVANDGIISKLREKEAYVSPGEKRREARKESERKMKKLNAKLNK